MNRKEMLIALCIAVLLFNTLALHSRLIDTNAKLFKLQQTVHENNMFQLSVQSNNIERIMQTDERIEVIENTFLDYDIAKRLDLILSEAIDNGYLLQ